MAEKRRTDALAPMLPEPSAVRILPPDEYGDAGGVLPQHAVRVVETRDELRSATAFLVKYAGLSVTLLVLTVAGTRLLDVAFFWWGAWTYGVLLIAGYAVLAWLEHTFTAYGTERTRLQLGAGVLRAQIDAQKDVQLALVDLQHEQVQAQREYNGEIMQQARERAQVQLARHETAQSSLNRLHTYVPPAGAQQQLVRVFDADDLEPPAWWTAPDEPSVRDSARRTLLDFLLTLYERDESTGEYVRLHADGRIRRHVRVPASSRSGLPPDERAQLVDLLHSLQVRGTGAWLLRYDSAQRLWRLNVKRYATVQDALDAVDTVRTGRAKI